MALLELSQWKWYVNIHENDAELHNLVHFILWKMFSYRIVKIYLGGAIGSGGCLPTPTGFSSASSIGTRISSISTFPYKIFEKRYFAQKLGYFSTLQAHSSEDYRLCKIFSLFSASQNKSGSGCEKFRSFTDCIWIYSCTQNEVKNYRSTSLTRY